MDREKEIINRKLNFAIELLNNRKTEFETIFDADGIINARIEEIENAISILESLKE